MIINFTIIFYILNNEIDLHIYNCIINIICDRSKMQTLTTKIQEQFFEILSEKKINPVYQPIVSLDDGEIFGYEGLSRIDMLQCEFNTEEMFQISERLNKVWELEELCRIKTLKYAENKPQGKKLFINVDPKVIRDEKFINGITGRYLKMYGLTPKDIVFEITERSSIDDADAFEKTVQHYKNQDYQIAIDDFGSGYAGLQRICALSTNFLKIDMTLVRDIDKDETKRTLVESFVLFCENANIGLIAEGIETREELQTLVQMGVSYGQGYYLGRPDTDLKEITYEIKELIKCIKLESDKYLHKPSFFGNVGSICKPKYITTPEVLGYTLFEYIESSPNISEICVIDSDKKVLGLLSKTKFLEKFSGRFGYSLYARKTARQLVDQDFLVVDAMTSVEQVSKMALARSINSLYDSVVVTQNDRYLGIVTVKDLLETAITIQVSRAVDANPLTKLPGNTAIENLMSSFFTSNKQFGFIYLDLDNFKAYNDSYGFTNGDLMIKATAKCMEECCLKKEFMGHIGGDDFVIITDYWDVEELCQSIINKFQEKIMELYSKEDLDHGYILSKNRDGLEETFQLATLSIAVVTNKNKTFLKLEEFSKDLANVKKKCKQTKGNVIICV